MGKRCYGTATVGYSINPSESEDGMRATYEGLEASFVGVFNTLRVCSDQKCELCRNIVDILNGAEMFRYRNSSKWEERKLPEAEQMSDEGGGHKAFVMNDRAGSRLLKCHQHIGSEFPCYVFDLFKFCSKFDNDKFIKI